MLKLDNIEVIYDEVLLVLRGISLEVTEGTIVALLGSNGAGKSTTLKAISGLLPSENGQITEGVISLCDRPITRSDPAAIVRLGISQVLEGRRVFEHLTVDENLRAGGHVRNGDLPSGLEHVYGYFPALADRRAQKAGYLSGGEQQMLAIGRALMSEPKLMLLDEPSLGLAPRVVAEIFEMIRRLNRELGTTILLVEQNARLALETADYAYLMENGRILLQGDADELARTPDVRELYLGLSRSGTRRSYRDVRHYRHRKRRF